FGETGVTKIAEPAREVEKAKREPPPPPPAAVPLGKIEVLSGTPGRIFVDGGDTGRDAPGTVENVIAGSHTVEVRTDTKYGQATVEVREHATAAVEVELNRSNVGSLQIVTHTPGAIITVNGKQLEPGSNTVQDLPAGSHQVRV